MGRQGHEETRSHKDQRLPRGWRAERAVSGFRWKNQQDAHPRRRRESGVTPALPGDCAGPGSPQRRCRYWGERTECVCAVPAGASARSLKQSRN